MTTTTKRTSWMNIYCQGFYHRCGKPQTLNCHPGDLYDTEEEAKAAIDKGAPYIATVGFEWDAPDTVEVYPAGSVPIPLRETRRAFEVQQAA